MKKVPNLWSLLMDKMMSVYLRLIELITSSKMGFPVKLFLEKMNYKLFVNSLNVFEKLLA